MNVDHNHPLARVLSRFLLEGFPEPIVVLDKDGAALELNRAARESRHFDVAGLFDRARRHPSIAAFLSELATQGHAALALQRTPAGNRAGHFMLEGYALECYFVVTVRDQSERRSLEEEVYQLRRVESLGLLTARVVHDLNNLLTPIMCLSHQLLVELGDGNSGGLLAADIEKAAIRAGALVRDVLAFARPRPVHSETLELNAVIAAMRPMLELLVDDGVELGLELAHDVGSVHVDRGRLEQALLNLVANARHTMPEGGRLTISMTNATLGQNNDRGPAPPAFVMLSVSDTGVGMTEDVRARAFEAFFTTRNAAGGTGLGLSSVQRFARESGGLVTLESKVGRGTTVSVYLPQLRATAAVQ